MAKTNKGEKENTNVKNLTETTDVSKLSDDDLKQAAKSQRLSMAKRIEIIAEFINR